MSRQTQFADYGYVYDEAGNMLVTKTTILSNGKYVPYCYMTLENLASWFACSDTPADKVKAFVIRHIDKSNLLCYTQKGIADKANVGVATVKRVMRDLEEAGVIKQISHGKWFVNPENFYMGRAAKREELQKQYDFIVRRKEKGDEQDE